MTHRIYYTEPYCRTFDAIVTRALEHEARPAVTLDRTAFYPASGGQPFDTGRLGAADVIETVEVSEEPVHVLSQPIAEGGAITGSIDWPRRFDHMQQHTGQHLLSAAFDRKFDNRTMSVHMGADLSTIDLARDASGADVERAVDEANRVVWEDRAVSIRFVSSAEAETLSLPKEPVRAGTLRLIEIDDFDLSACGGTHVARTGTVGMIAALGAERLRGGTRLTFVCGGRALRALRTHRDAVAASVRPLSVLPGDLPAAVERVLAEAKDLRRTIKGLHGALAVHEAARLLSDAQDVSGVRVAVDVLDGWDLAGLKALALSATAGGRACVALLSSASILIARSAGVPVDAHAVLGQLMDRFGGRGGGKPDLAQGGGMTGSTQEIASVVRGLLEAALRS